MSKIIIPHITGKTCYFVVLDSSGNAYNGSTYETPAAGSWTTYDIALTEASTTAIYEGTFPALAAGSYSIIAYEQLGGSPAATDKRIGTAQGYWDGGEVTPAEITPSGNASQSTAYLTTYDGKGNTQASVVITFRLEALSAEDAGMAPFGGDVAGGGEFTATSDANGLLTVLLIRNATYRARRGHGDEVEFTVPNASTYELPVILGFE